MQRPSNGRLGIGRSGSSKLIHPPKPKRLDTDHYLQRRNIHMHLLKHLLRRPFRPHLRPNPLPAFLTPPRPNPRRPHPRRRSFLHAHRRLPLRQTAAPLCIRPTRLSINVHRLCHPSLPRTRPKRRQVRRALLRRSGLLRFPLPPLDHPCKQREWEIQNCHRNGLADRSRQLRWHHHQSHFSRRGSSALSDGLFSHGCVVGDGGAAYGGVYGGYWGREWEEEAGGEGL